HRHRCAPAFWPPPPPVRRSRCGPGPASPCPTPPAPRSRRRAGRPAHPVLKSSQILLIALTWAYGSAIISAIQAEIVHCCPALANHASMSSSEIREPSSEPHSAPTLSAV